MENATDTQFENLFPDNKTVSALPIGTYLNWAAHPEKYSRELAIPPIQRGFVWKPKQIQDLWDSLLRGMPIGSILLKASNPGELSAELPSLDRIAKKSQKSGFHLMDGQQRTLSMLLGFPGSTGAQHKLWVDFSEPGKNGSQFQFRVTTAAQSFGYNVDGGRFSLHERREAREKWDGKNSIREMQTNIDIFNDETSRPWKAGGKRQEYIFEVKNLWQWLDEHRSRIPDWVETIQTKITMNEGTVPDKVVLERIMNFGDSLKELKKQSLALIKIPDIKLQTDLQDPSHDYLTMLFDRISSGGTRLSPDDLLFSMIKQSWPDAHNIVYELQKEQFGSLMKPTDFVMTAFRLAALQSDDIRVRNAELNAKAFHNHLGSLLGTEEVPGALRKMIAPEGPLIAAFKKLVTLIEYCDDDQRSHAIPSAMFPYMNESMLQVILYWLMQNQENTDSLEESRNEIVRFILFWFVCNKDAASAYKASKIAIEIISAHTGHFPGMRIYQTLTHKDDDSEALFHPLIEHLEKEFDNDRFRTKNDRETHYFGVENKFLYGNFNSRIGLLLWFQRKWVKCKYGDNFKPNAGQDEDNVPYDFDHLIPQSNWSSLNGIHRGEIKKEENKKVFEDRYHRRVLGNSIGNYRVMDSSENRSRGNESLQLSLLQTEVQTEGKWNDYSFNPAGEIELQKWRLASPIKDELKWDDDRLLAFQYAIESRVLYLYKRYFEEARFEAWVSG